MAKVKLADGRIMQVPDGSTPEQVQVAVNQVKVRERAPFAEMAGEQAQNAINRIGREATTQHNEFGPPSTAGLEHVVSEFGAGAGAPTRLSDVVTGPAHFLRHPIDSVKNLLSSLAEAQQKQIDRAYFDQHTGNIGGGIEGLRAALPVAGPMLQGVADQMDDNDFSGGIAKLGGMGAAALAGSPEGRTAALDAATLPVRGGKALVRRVRDTGIAPQAAENFANRAMGTTTADLDAGVNPGRTMVRSGMPVAATKGGLLKKVGARQGELSKVLPPDHPMMGDLDIARQNISHDIHQSRTTSPIHMSDWETGAAVGVPVGIMEGMAGGGGEGLTRGMEAAITGMLVKKGVESTPFRTAAAKVLGPWGKETVGPEFRGYPGDTPQLRPQPTPMGPVPEPPQPVPPELEGNTVDTPVLPSARGRKLSTVTPATPQTLYHGTHADSVPGIQEKGLIPQREFVDQNFADDPARVHLFDNPDMAAGLARKFGPQGRVLKLELPRGAASAHPDQQVAPGRYTTSSPVPPSNIREVMEVPGPSPTPNTRPAGVGLRNFNTMGDNAPKRFQPAEVPHEVTADDAATTASLRSAMDASAADMNELAVKRNFIRNKPPGAYQPKTLRLHDPDGTPALEVPLSPKESEAVYGDQPVNAGHGGPGAMLRKGSKLLRPSKSGPMTGDTANPVLLQHAVRKGAHDFFVEGADEYNPHNQSRALSEYGGGHIEPSDVAMTPEYTDQTVDYPTKSIMPSQFHVDPALVNKYMDEVPSDRPTPIVVESQGNRILTDGHHRLTAGLKTGRKFIRAERITDASDAPEGPARPGTGPGATLRKKPSIPSAEVRIYAPDSPLHPDPDLGWLAASEDIDDLPISGTGATREEAIADLSRRMSNPDASDLEFKKWFTKNKLQKRK